MRRALIMTLAIVACSAWMGERDAHAGRKVFLNGVDLDGAEVPAAVFKSCTVKISDKGDVYITAPGVKLEPKADKADKADRKRRPAPRKKAAKPTLTRHYFLIARESRRGASDYDVAVYINGTRFTTIRSNAEPIATEITGELEPGDNSIQLLARKTGKTTGSADDFLEIQIAEGDVVKGEAVIRDTVLTYKRTAAESAAFRDSYRLTTR